MLASAWVRRQRVVAVGAVLHADHHVSVVPESEPLEDLEGPRPVWLRDPQADDDGVALVDGLYHLEPTTLLIKVRKAANDLPTGASGGRLLDVRLLDCPPHDGAVQETDPGSKLATPQRVVGVPDHRVPLRGHTANRRRTQRAPLTGKVGARTWSRSAGERRSPPAWQPGATGSVSTRRAAWVHVGHQ